jgi:hypothetical protein
MQLKIPVKDILLYGIQEAVILTLSENMSKLIETVEAEMVAQEDDILQ